MSVMIEFVQGDMFAIPADIRVNTVNCVGVMGAGMALAFKQRYPAMFKDYQRACKAGEVRPGRLHEWRSLEGDWVLNFPTKRDWRDSSRYEDIDAGLDALRDYLSLIGPVTVALPALGCGHGGLDWSRVSQMIEAKLSDVPATIKVFAPADSKRAGTAAVAKPSEEELRAASELGYRYEAGPGEQRVFVSGAGQFDAKAWIAVVPSRAPSVRELAALTAVADELFRRSPDTRVALVHVSKATEEVARVFAASGLKTVVILPFGVLTRRPIAKLPLSLPGITLISFAPTAAKWTRELARDALDQLEAGARSVLLSDPAPDWILRRLAKARGRLPCAYLRYDGLDDHIRQQLSAIGAQPLGRRSDTGAPNLDMLLAERGGVPVLPMTDAERGSRLTIDLLELPRERWADVIALLGQASLERLSLEVRVGDEDLAALLDDRVSRLAARPGRSEA